VANHLVELRSVAARAGTTPILRSIDLTLDSGEVVGLVGPNGCGKTTLLRLIATHVRMSAGEGHVLGADLAGDDRFDVRRRIGFIGHLPALYPELSLRENLVFAARAAGIEEGYVPRALAEVGLEGAADRRTEACSHGMQRRAEFARELMLQPTLLLLDEPHSALDASSVTLVGHLLDDVRERGGGAILVSHDRDRLEPLVDRLVSLEGGVVA
jgi:heme ABC exporter ATP-binding subunit CcmA